MERRKALMAGDLIGERACALWQSTNFGRSGELDEFAISLTECRTVEIASQALYMNLCHPYII